MHWEAYGVATTNICGIIVNDEECSYDPSSLVRTLPTPPELEGRRSLDIGICLRPAGRRHLFSSYTCIYFQSCCNQLIAF